MDMGNYDGMSALNRLCFRMNLIKEISGISTNTALTELDLYDNMLQRIENIEVIFAFVTAGVPWRGTQSRSCRATRSW